MKRTETAHPGATHAAKRIHLVYPHGARLSAPDSIGRHLGQRLEASYEVVYHEWHERGVIRPRSGDVLLGHPHPDPDTVFRRSARERGWARILILAPYTHDLRQVGFVDSVIRDCDLYLAITGPFWFGSVASSSCSHWRPKMIQLDLAVDRSEFPVLGREFRPAGKRTFAYIGSTAWFKNTPYLTELARRMPGVRFGWIGAGERVIDGLEPLGPADFSTAEGRAMVAQFDFMVTLGKADANPTTILEAMAWGLLPICTPESGYVGIPSITNVPRDDPGEAAARLAGMNSLPIERLLAMQTANWRLLDDHYNWERFTVQVIEAIESAASPALGPESYGRRIVFAWNAQRSPHGPLLTGLHRGTQTVHGSLRRSRRWLRHRRDQKVQSRGKPMTLAQWTLDAALRLQGAGGMRRLELTAVRAARKAQLRVHDPLVTYQIGEIALQLPLSHQLPYFRRTFPQYSSNIGRIGAAVQRKYPDMSLIDIGANVGDTVAIVRQQAYYPILCVEGSTAYLPLLQRNVDHLGDVEVEAAFVGGTSGPVGASLQLADGTAHLAMGGLAEGTVSLHTLEEILLRHPKFATSKLVKSDTDGMDCQIIAGAADFLATMRPVLFFEYAPDLAAQAGATAIRVFDVLESAGYRYALMYENTGDLMFLLDLQDKRLLADVDSFFSGRDVGRYADICAFHAKDSDLALSLRETEAEFLLALRGNGEPRPR